MQRLLSNQVEGDTRWQSGFGEITFYIFVDFYCSLMFSLLHMHTKLINTKMCKSISTLLKAFSKIIVLNVYKLEVETLYAINILCFITFYYSEI